MNVKWLAQVVRSGVCLAGGVMLYGCVVPAAGNEAVEQPLEFNHATHIRYFLDGRHKAENIKRHIGDSDAKDAPVELLEGRCLECHETFDDIPECGRCHLTFQDANTKTDRSRRPCLGCHRSAWTSSRASIPTVALCTSCHGQTPRTPSDQEKILRAYIDRAEDIPWIQVNVLAANVEFPHVAHVRFGSLACASCHPQASDQRSQPQATGLTMRDCVRCHEQRKADNSCLACHK